MREYADQNNSEYGLFLRSESIDVILTSVFSKNIGDDAFNLKEKFFSFISKSWPVQKEVIQYFHIKTTNRSRIKCA